jgi:hypothetical protein
MKKLLSLLFALAIVVSLYTRAFAQKPINDSKNISDGAAKGQASELKKPVKKTKKAPHSTQGKGQPDRANTTTSRSNTQHN